MTNQTEVPSTNRGAPTEKMLAAAERAASRHGLKVPSEALTNFEACRQFLDEYINKPSAKALAFAEKIARDNGLEIPAETLTNSRDLSAWIDANKAA